jgi:hypothetical protein
VLAPPKGRIRMSGCCYLAVAIALIAVVLIPRLPRDFPVGGALKMPTGAHRNGEAATPGTGGSEDRSGGMLIIRSLIRSSTAARLQGKKLVKARGGAPPGREGGSRRSSRCCEMLPFAHAAVRPWGMGCRLESNACAQ